MGLIIFVLNDLNHMFGKTEGCISRVCDPFYIVLLSLVQVRTSDLGGYASSDEFTRAVIANLTV